MEWDVSLLIYALSVGLCAGMLAGFMAGLAGVGGGLIYVPVFYLAMPNAEANMALSIFSSLVAIALTSFFSARRHWQLKHIDLHLFHCLWPSLLLGASLGLWSALILPELWILLALATLNVWVAYDYGRPISLKTQAKGWLRFFGIPIGYISGVLGIAGGTMLVPLLRRFLTLKSAVGTSSACGAVMVMLAVLLNVLGESAWQKILQDQWAILLAVWLGVLLSMPLAAKKTAAWHDKFQERHLRIVLKAMFSLLAMMFFLVAWLK